MNDPDGEPPSPPAAAATPGLTRRFRTGCQQAGISTVIVLLLLGAAGGYGATKVAHLRACAAQRSELKAVEVQLQGDHDFPTPPARGYPDADWVDDASIYLAAWESGPRCGDDTIATYHFIQSTLSCISAQNHGCGANLPANERPPT